MYVLFISDPSLQSLSKKKYQNVTNSRTYLSKILGNADKNMPPAFNFFKTNACRYANFALVGQFY